MHPLRRVLPALLAVAIAVVLGGLHVWRAPSALAASCSPGVEVDLAGSADVAVVSGRVVARCSPKPGAAKRRSGPWYSYRVACSASGVSAANGLCSVTSCAASGRLFAFRTLHRTDGTTAPAGTACVSPRQALVGPGVSFAQSAAAIRRVKLPGGSIRAMPGRGLAHLPSYFWVDGAKLAAIDLPIGASVLHTEFRVVEFHWTFGNGESLVTEGPGTPGRGSEVEMTYARRGRWPVRVRLMWSAEAFLDGTRVGEVDGLSSSASMVFPVAELRTLLL